MSTEKSSDKQAGDGAPVIINGGKHGVTITGGAGGAHGDGGAVNITGGSGGNVIVQTTPESAKPAPEALIKVSEGGTNFQMIDCEFQLGNSGRPAIETKADGTKIKRTLVSTTSTDDSLGEIPNPAVPPSDEPPPDADDWHERPLGKIWLTVIGGILVLCAVYALRHYLGFPI